MAVTFTFFRPAPTRFYRVPPLCYHSTSGDDDRLGDRRRYPTAVPRGEQTSTDPVIASGQHSYGLEEDARLPFRLCPRPVCPISTDFLSSTQIPCSVFQLGMALDAVYARNTLQFFALT